MKLYTGVGGRENNAIALQEPNSNDESLTDVEHVYVYLLWTRVSY